ncbi:MAG: hypothetical protein JNJ83_13435 [Verrucomicrobiaceae bacterium]|nr:hypothetical protein [Verrucomicrobiaceae bacterium]
MIRCLILITLATMPAIGTFGQVPPLPSDAQSLRKAYDEARQRALQPLEQKYRDELEKLLAAHTKAGRLDDAIAIRAELSSLSAPTASNQQPKQTEPATAKPSAPVAATLHGTRWKAAKADKPVIIFRTDKDILQVLWAEGGSGSYDYTVDRRKVSWKMGGRPQQTFNFSNDWKSFEWNGIKMVPADAP